MSREIGSARNCRDLALLQVAAARVFIGCALRASLKISQLARQRVVGRRECLEALHVGTLGDTDLVLQHVNVAEHLGLERRRAARVGERGPQRTGEVPGTRRVTLAQRQRPTPIRGVRRGTAQPSTSMLGSFIQQGVPAFVLVIAYFFFH